MPVAPPVGIRVPQDLREQVQSFAHERRWTFLEATRVALEQLVGYVERGRYSGDQPPEAQR